MKSAFLKSVIVLSAALAGSSVYSAETGTMELYCSSAHSLVWSTLTTNEVDIALTWPADATSASLTVKDIAGVTVHSAAAEPGTASYAWTVFTGGSPAADACFTVKVVYLSGETEISSEEAMLTLSKGSFGAVDVFSGPESLSFSRTLTGRAVAYNSRWFGRDTAPLTMSVTERGSGAEENFSSEGFLNGYFVWNPFPTGGPRSYDFTLSCGGDGLSGRALLVGAGKGTVMTLR